MLSPFNVNICDLWDFLISESTKNEANVRGHSDER